MKKTDRLSDWEEKETRDRNANGIDDEIEPPGVDVRTGSDELSGGDIDARWEMSESAGDESAAGSVSTPDQDNVGEIGHAIGIDYNDDETLKFGEKERSRDKKRFELDPASSDDWQERNRDRNR
ncbi:MAG: DUF6335 family protein [Thermoanaerobaculia bacterium]